MGLHQSKNLCSKGNQQRNEKANQWIRKKFANHYLRSWYPKYLKNTYNSISNNNMIKKWTEDLNRYFSQRHTDGQQAYENRHQSSGKCKLKLQWDIAWHLPEWRSSKWQQIKNLPANAGDTRDVGSIPWSGRFHGGDGNTLQYSCLDNLMDKGVCQATVHGVAKTLTWLSTQAI